MKKLLVGLGAIFICTFAIAHSIEWYVGDSLYQTTTCDAGYSVTPPTAPEKYGYHFVEWSEYTQLEYIESTGTQYIDTGVVPTKNTKIEIHNIQKVSDTAFGVYGQIYVFNNGFNNHYNFGDVPNSGSYTEPNLRNLDATIVMSKDDGLVINGQQIVAFSDVNDFTTDLTFWLFARNNPTPNYKMGAQRTYYFKMWNNGTLVRNLIPARRNSDNVLGMYDTVSGLFFTNAGTGTFIAGPEVGGL